MKDLFRKTIVLVVFVILGEISIKAQEVANVTFRQEGQQVIITYDLSEKSDISVEVSTDGGATFGTPSMTHVSGDVGKNIVPGQSKSILWDVLQDCDRLQGNYICFRVNASKALNDIRIITVGDISFKMIYVEGGTFTMGCTKEQGRECNSDEYPAHLVTLSDYYIGETEVTQALWKAVTGGNPSYWQNADYAVDAVSYEKCLFFITDLNSMTGLNFRLPTEAEWEYAARGGKKSKGYRYSGSNRLDKVAWYADNNGRKVHPVKLKLPNELGLYDMSGGVWELCNDRYGSYSIIAETDPTGPSSGQLHLFRGGSYQENASQCRVTCRLSHLTCGRIGQGLRLVLDP